MKVHRLSFLLALVLLSSVLLAAPAQAGPTASSFVFSIEDVSVAFSQEHTGPVSHRTWLLTGQTVSDDDRLHGAMTIVIHVMCVWPNAHNDETVPEGYVWGPAALKWEIVTSAQGEPLSGWRGTGRTAPQVSEKWEDLLDIYYGQGSGFGIYRGMHIEWRADLAEGLIYRGQIK